MAMTDERPWHFTIEFDADKAAREGYTVDELLAFVDHAASIRDMVRIDRNTWQAVSKEREFATTYATILWLSQRKLILNTVKTWTVYDSDAPDGADYLKDIEAVPLSRLY